MKFIILMTLLASSTAIAYTSSPANNHPVKDPMITMEKRDPASTEVKAVKSDKDHQKKSSEIKKQ